MDETTRADIRRLLRTFGVKADEAISAHIERHPGGRPLRLRITLEDLTEYEGERPSRPLSLVVEEEIQREEAAK